MNLTIQSSCQVMIIIVVCHYSCPLVTLVLNLMHTWCRSHHRLLLPVDRVISGSRLLKAGMDGHYAIVLDLTWSDPSSPKGTQPDIISAHFVKVCDFPPGKFVLLICNSGG